MQKGDRYYVIFSFKGIIHSSYLYSIHVYIITYGYTLLKLNKKRRTYSSPMIFSHLDTLWGGLWDSNPWPSGPQSDALTSWAKPAIPLFCKQDSKYFLDKFKQDFPTWKYRVKIYDTNCITNLFNGILWKLGEL